MHHGGVSTPWATVPPPARDRALGTSPELRGDAAAAALVATVLVLLGAPLGLLWAAVAPRVQVVLGDAGPGLVDPESGAFLGADLAFGLLVLLAGLACGLLALLPRARPHGPGVVVGLLAGGLLAAYVAAQTGEQVGLEEFRAAVREGVVRGTVEASVRLRATEALVLWPAAALAAFAVGTALRPEPPAVSSG